MKERIKDKIDEIDEYLNELMGMVPNSLEEYKRDLKTKAACERYTEKIIEAIIDLAFLLIKEKRLNSPESDLQVFDILSDNKIISIELAKRLQDAKGMRNILAHEYGRVDDEIVFNSITEEFEKDVKELLKEIKRRF